MKYIYYLAFVSAVIVLGWIFRPIEEHMTNGTCKRSIYGPQAVDAEKCARVYPDVYGPTGSGMQYRGTNIADSKPGVIRDPKTGVIRNSTAGGTRESTTGSSRDPTTGDVLTPTSTTAMYDDDGEFRSDTATRNAAYMNVFTFQPYAKMDFPTSGPPQPYLTDFATFHR